MILILLLFEVVFLSSFWIGSMLSLLAGAGIFGYYFWKYRDSLAPPSEAIDGGRVGEILLLHFTYYQNLSESRRLEFVNRVTRFIQEKQFIPRNFEKVSLEMQVLIGAAAVQLTFGLPEITLEHFDKILIYPQQYFSVINRQYHKGEVNPKAGAIVLSWNNFMQGYAVPNDSFNLGLHEMAHALKLENVIRNNEYGFLSDEMLRQWQDQAIATIQIIRQGNQTFFRDYAATNEEEFFAVAVENFFERPGSFRKEFPHLFQTLVSLLKQDPLSITDIP